jgi:hypothetical protein
MLIKTITRNFCIGLLSVVTSVNVHAAAGVAAQTDASSINPHMLRGCIELDIRVSPDTDKALLQSHLALAAPSLVSMKLRSAAPIDFNLFQELVFPNLESLLIERLAAGPSESFLTSLRDMEKLDSFTVVVYQGSITELAKTLSDMSSFTFLTLHITETPMDTADMAALVKFSLMPNKTLSLKR